MFLYHVGCFCLLLCPILTTFLALSREKLSVDKIFCCDRIVRKNNRLGEIFNGSSTIIRPFTKLCTLQCVWYKRLGEWVGEEQESFPVLTEGLVTEQLNLRNLEGRPWSEDFNLIDHAARIAFLVEEGWDDPIEIDLGIPGMCEGRLNDGFHRCAAAIYKRDRSIKAHWSGSMDLAIYLTDASEGRSSIKFDAFGC